LKYYLVFVSEYYNINYKIYNSFAKDLIHFLEKLAGMDLKRLDFNIMYKIIELLGYNYEIMNYEKKLYNIILVVLSKKF
jgi:hypothetical protein